MGENSSKLSQKPIEIIVFGAIQQTDAHPVSILKVESLNILLIGLSQFP